MKCVICKKILKKYIDVKNLENFKKFKLLKCQNCEHTQTYFSKNTDLQKYYNVKYYGTNKQKFTFFLKKFQ